MKLLEASAGISLDIPPQDDELEVSLFGPGFGESIVIHLGGGKWGIVDSCVDPKLRRPAALNYLETIGVRAEESVVFVLASHWHDDHIRGLSEIFKVSKAAKFSCSQAIGSSQFHEILANWSGTRFQVGGSGVDELYSIMQELRRRAGNSNLPSPILASANKILWQTTNPFACRITSLSPSDAGVIAAIAQFAQLSPKIDRARRRMPRLSANDTSVVVSIQVADQSVLLGADLEVRSDPALGWKALLGLCSETYEKHCVFKVPHHGSETAHHETTWDRIISSAPHALVTPFVAGRVKLPLLRDCHRLIRRTPFAYLSAPPRAAKFHDTSHTVEKTVLNVSRYVHRVPGSFGQVRLRKSLAPKNSEEWSAELFGDALTIADYVRSQPADSQ